MAPQSRTALQHPCTHLHSHSLYQSSKGTSVCESGEDVFEFGADDDLPYPTAVAVLPPPAPSRTVHAAGSLPSLIVYPAAWLTP
jgi:hypothetical protein